MEQTHQKELKKIYSKYSKLRCELTSLEKQAETLSDAQQRLRQELENTRMAESNLINKIEQDLNRKITQDDLIKIISSNEA